MAFKKYYNKTIPSLMVITFFTTACSTHKTKQKTTPPVVKKTLIPASTEVNVKRYVAKPQQKQIKRRITETPKRNRNPFGNRLSAAATERTRHNVTYDGRYVKIGYPWGDVPQNIGVCTDVVIRSYRRLGIDLQQQVHTDMQSNFNAYPNLSKWKLKSPDSNIDHRRVYNMRAFFARHGQSLPITNNPNHFQPGDVVTWQLGPGQGHVGIVVNQRSKQDPRRHLIVHNIAEGPKMEDVLFRFRMSGHYRYNGKMRQYNPTYLAKNNQTQHSIPGIGKIPPELLR